MKPQGRRPAAQHAGFLLPSLLLFLLFALSAPFAAIAQEKSLPSEEPPPRTEERAPPPEGRPPAKAVTPVAPRRAVTPEYETVAPIETETREGPTAEEKGKELGTQIRRLGAQIKGRCCCVKSITLRNTAEVTVQIRVDIGGGKGTPVSLGAGRTHTVTNAGECLTLSFWYSTGEGKWGFAGQREFCCREMQPGPLKGFPGLEIVSIEKGPCEKPCRQPSPPKGKGEELGKAPREGTETAKKPPPEKPGEPKKPREDTGKPKQPPEKPGEPKKPRDEPEGPEKPGDGGTPPPGGKPGGGGKPKPGDGKPTPDKTETPPPPCKCRFERADWMTWRKIVPEYEIPRKKGEKWKYRAGKARIPLKANAFDWDLLALTSVETDAKGKVRCRGKKFLPFNHDRVYFRWKIEGKGTFLNGGKEDGTPSVIYVPPALDPGDEERVRIETYVDDTIAGINAKGDDPQAKGIIHLVLKRGVAEPESDFVTVEVERIEGFARPPMPPMPSAPPCDCNFAKTQWLPGMAIVGAINRIPDPLCVDELNLFEAAGLDKDDLLAEVTSKKCGGDKKVLKNIPDVMRYKSWGADSGKFIRGSRARQGKRVIYRAPPKVPADKSPNLKITLGEIDDAENSQYDDKPIDDERRATIIDLDLDIARPDGTWVPEEQETDPGGWVWFNSDNDDGDDEFDHAGLEGEVPTGDDELVKVRLQARPAKLQWPGKKVRLKAADGATLIRLFEDNKRRRQVTLPAEYAFKDLPKILYLEGAWPSGKHRNVRLVLECVGSEPCRDEVAVTVFDIKKLTWEGKGNSASDGDTLDADPHPNAPAGGLRVFPGARLEGGKPGFPRDTVKVWAHLNLPALQDMEVHLKSFDVDDPSANTALVDAENQVEDNRGTVKGAGKSGEIDGQDKNGVRKLTIPKDTFKAGVAFEVTRQPGDNFVIAAVVDADLFKRLRNSDQAGDGTEIHDPDAGAYTKASPVLTVWRRVHIEVDSMGKVAGNEVKGKITHLYHASGSAQGNARVWVDKRLWDGSPDLSASKKMDLGRFENGTLTVAGVNTTAGLQGNGRDFVHRDRGIGVVDTPLPFSAVDNDYYGNATMSGKVTVILREKPGSATRGSGPLLVRLDITAHSETPIDWPDFKGGTIAIGGGPAVKITDVRPANNSVVVERLAIPFKLTDDDQISGDVSAPDTSHMAAAFRPAYVTPVYDVGDGNSDVPFVLNLSTLGRVKRYDFDAKKFTQLKDFWTVYLLGAYQAETRRDLDPNSREPGLLGIVDDIVGLGALVFQETSRDCAANRAGCDRNKITTAHEIGHLFGGLHGDGGLMAGGGHSGNAFTPASLAVIRSNVCLNRWGVWKCK